MTQPEVTVYTLPNCVQCNATKRELDKLDIKYETVDLSQHPDLADTFRERGHATAPIVTAGDETWSGFRLNRIRNLATKKDPKPVETHGEPASFTNIAFDSGRIYERNEVLRMWSEEANTCQCEQPMEHLRARIEGETR